MGLWGSFTGRDQQRDIQGGAARARGYLDSGRTNARGDITGGRDRAMGMINPYIQSGQRGQTAYEDTLGLNGQGARDKAFQTGYMNDPALAYRKEQTGNQINSLMRKYNAGGSGVNSGAAALGAGRIESENFNSDWGGYQNRLQGLGQQGMQASQFGAGLEYGAGKDLANIETGYANTSAGLEQQTAGAMANSRDKFLNNLVGLGGLAVRGIGAFTGQGGQQQQGQQQQYGPPQYGPPQQQQYGPPQYEQQQPQQRRGWNMWG